MAPDDPSGRASHRGRAHTMEDERRERLHKLVLCREKLSADEAALLRDVFPEIFAAHHELVWSRLRRRGLQSHEAEDLLQEAFLTLHDHILENGFPENVRGMLRSITEGKLVNYVHAKRRAPMSVCIPSSSSEQVKSGPDVERALDLQRLAQRVIPQLSPEHQEVIEKVILNGLSHRDAADLLNLPEGTVKSRLIAAKRALVDLAEPLLPKSQRGPA